MCLNLHEKSLLNVIEMDDAPDGLRFRALDMVREYGEEQLGRRGQLDAMRARHQDFYLGLTEGLAQSMFTTIEVQQRIYIERFNLLAIARHTADGNVLVRCLLVLDDVLQNRAHTGYTLICCTAEYPCLSRAVHHYRLHYSGHVGDAYRRRAKFDEAQKRCATRCAPRGNTKHSSRPQPRAMRSCCITLGARARDSSL